MSEPSFLEYSNSLYPHTEFSENRHCYIIYEREDWHDMHSVATQIRQQEPHTTIIIVHLNGYEEVFYNADKKSPVGKKTLIKAGRWTGGK